MFDYLTSFNDHNLPYPDTIHPIVVHFVIAMVLFAFVCDVVGYFTGNALHHSYSSQLSPFHLGFVYHWA
ncbi:DUF2231 domain-containing protein [Nostoc sp.]|uniref:DUF2231 domain-containing protein n=1 Tax=Nostoc sp. TaxID=1180 RepID=UPI003FA5D200